MASKSKEGRARVGKLESKHELAIVALMQEPTVLGAAKRLGIAECTLHDWMSRPEFQSAWEEARERLLAHAVANMAGALGDAVSCLWGVVNSATARDADRIRAAKTLIDSILNVKAMSMRNRVDGGDDWRWLEDVFGEG